MNGLECTTDANGSKDTNRADAYMTILSPYMNELRAYCRYLTRSTWDSEDLYQETLLKTYVYYQHAGAFSGVRAFLYTVARNPWIDDYRKRRRRIVYGDVIYLQGAYEDVYPTNIQDIVEWLYYRLPKRNIDMLLLAEMFDYSNQQIADELSSTIPAVKCTLYRTRRMIKGLNGKLSIKKKEAKVSMEEVNHCVKALIKGTPLHYSI